MKRWGEITNSKKATTSLSWTWQAAGDKRTAEGVAGGLIMSASHNPGGPKEDWGIKFNYTAGEPAPERITDKIFGFTQDISELKFAEIPDTDLSKIGTQSYGDFEVTVISAQSMNCCFLRSCCESL